MPYYQLDADALCMGDVILEAGVGKVPFLIKVFDFGLRFLFGKVYYHALLYVGSGFVIEATREGVRMFEASRIITRNPGDYAILRHRDYPNGIKRGLWGDLADPASRSVLANEIHKKYNLLGAAATKLSFLRRLETDNPDGFFCSELVAVCYERLEIEIFNKRTKPALVTPSKLQSKDWLLQPQKIRPFFMLDNHFNYLHLMLDRYYVIKNEPLAINQRWHDLYRIVVETFGPRLEALTAEVGHARPVRTWGDLIDALTLRELPDGDEVSDDVVVFLISLSLTNDMKERDEGLKAVAEEMASVIGKPLRDNIIRGLRTSIPQRKAFIRNYERQLDSLRPEKVEPSRKWRSILDWRRGDLTLALERERNMHVWEKDLLRRLEDDAGAARRVPAGDRAAGSRPE